MTKPIRLRAQDEDDLKVVSACLQDAIVPIGDMCYLPRERRFVMVANRFKWEEADRSRPGPAADDDDLLPFERTHCGLHVENVTGVKLRGIDLKDRSQILELLSLEPYGGGGIVLHFAGGGCIRLEGASWQCFMEDLGEPWPTGCKPCHPLEE
jgi:hypothetical protein